MFMNAARKSVLSAACLTMFLFPSAETAMAQQQSGRFEITVKHELNYLIWLPEEHSEDGDPVPLLLFLHGAGERGDDLEKLKVHGPPKMIEAGHKFPAIVVSPQCPEESWWPREVDALIGLLDQIEKAYNVDKQRIYVTGLSMGGYGTWHLGGRQPGRFAALVPICGGGDRAGARDLGQEGVPIWAFHGDHDFVVPVTESVEMVNGVNRQRNGRARLTVFPDTDHNSWDPAYENEEMWEWLFAQKRETDEEADE
jgi:predicted peptidase